jgi:hypothetical protein
VKFFRESATAPKYMMGGWASRHEVVEILHLKVSTVYNRRVGKGLRPETIFYGVEIAVENKSPGPPKPCYYYTPIHTGPRSVPIKKVNIWLRQSL